MKEPFIKKPFKVTHLNTKLKKIYYLSLSSKFLFISQ